MNITTLVLTSFSLVSDGEEGFTFLKTTPETARRRSGTTGLAASKQGTLRVPCV